MFSLYIDHILIDDYHSFSEIRDFIFDFYYDVVKDEEYFDLADFTDFLDDYMDDLIEHLIFNRRCLFEYYDHLVEVYYGRSKI